ncbi:aminoglycoside phosphotransferase family protein [Nocardioides aestuarii]
MHDDQVDPTPDDVRRLLSAQHPQWSGLPVTRVAESGTDHALFRLGDDLVARLPVIAWADGQATAEAACWPPLAPHLPVAVPVPLALGVPDDGYPFAWSVNPWLPGGRPDASTDRMVLARDLAGFVGALRGCDATAAPPATSRGLPLDRPERDAATRRSLARSGDVVDATAALAAWEEARRAPVWPGPPTWLHGDLTAGNLLVVDGRLSAVIDAAPVAGDPAVELAACFQLFGPADRALVRETLGTDDAEWARARGWAVSIAAMEIAYYRETRPELAERSIRSIEAVLSE